jgi:MFS family permease
VPRNVWAASVTSFLTDVSTEMVVNVIPLFLANVLGARTAVIGLVEGVAEAVASLLKAPAGMASDRLGSRKWPAVAGYGISACAKPFLLGAATWGAVAGVRWADRVGKGVRTAPRDALVADSIPAGRRGLAFGLHRAADTGGAVGGLVVAALVVGAVQGGGTLLERDAFRMLVWASLLPAFLAVAVLAGFARDTRPRESAAAKPRLRGLGRPFFVFLAISAVFDLGNSSDAFLVLRAQERGLAVTDVLWTLVAFNAVYAGVSTPAGALSDRWGRKHLLLAGWIVYAAVYTGFALAESERHVVALFVVYGAYHGLTAGTARALVADLVPERLRGSAYGTYHATLGVIDLPASLLAGVLWEGVGSFGGFGAAAPFWAGGSLALVAALLLAVWVPEPARD